ncbi:MAG: DUF2092 domain-containing protein [Roseobacter sp.]
MKFLSGFILAAAAGLLALTTPLAARADETQARDILKSMSDYLAAAETLSFDYDATLDVVTTDGQILGIASSGMAALSRPDKFRATREGGYSALEVTLDQDVMSVAARHAGVYVQAPVTDGLDGMFDLLREQHGFILPAADLLSDNAYDVLMADVTDVKDLGTGMIRGQLCDHLAFRTPEVDWQIWIAATDQPYLCRFVIITPTFEQGPRYTLDISNWQSDITLPADSFSFAPPDDLRMTTTEQLQAAANEFPDHFMIGASQ